MQEGIEELAELEYLEESNPEISIHALTGTQNFQTMRVRGFVGKKELHILIDTGSTHNFLNVATGQSLDCNHTPVSPVKVTAANGSLLTCEAQFYTTDVLLIELDTYDMVLGVQWLTQLGDITWNFNNLSMKLTNEGQECILQGIPKQGVQLLSSEGLVKKGTSGHLTNLQARRG